MSNEPKAESRTVDSVVGNRRFRVWFFPINTTSFDVDAANEMDAQLKATMKWRDEYHTPILTQLIEISNPTADRRATAQEKTHE